MQPLQPPAIKRLWDLEMPAHITKRFKKTAQGVVLKELLDLILQKNIKTKRQLEKLKLQIAREYKLKEIPRNSELLEYYRKCYSPTERPQHDVEMLKLLQKKPIRTKSGVSIVAVMTKPHNCPGNCVYCPETEGIPKSYVGQ